MKKNDQRTHTCFLDKYGGLSLYDIDMEKIYSIDNKGIHFLKVDGYALIGKPDHYLYPTLVPLVMPYFRVLRSYSEVGRTAGQTSVPRPATSKNDVALIYHNLISTYVTNI